MASDAPPTPSSTSNAADSYIGSFISLISRYEIRYEGVLYFLNVKDSTIGLKNVKSYGTEGRKKDGPQVPPNDKVYEYILFRGSDIKDLQVKSAPPAKAEEQLYNDPAIIQTHYTGLPFSTPPVAVGGKTQYQYTPAVISKVKPEEMYPYQSGMHLSCSDHTQSAESIVASHFFTPPTSVHSLSQHGPLAPGTVQNQVQLSEPQASAAGFFTTTSKGISPLPSSVGSFPVHPTLSSSQTPVQLFNSPLVSASAANFSVSQDWPLTPFNNVSMPPMINSQAVPDSSTLYPVPTLGGPTSGPLLTPPPSLLAPNQLAQPGYSAHSQMQSLYSNNVRGTVVPTQADIFLTASQTPGEPLLAPPTSAPQQISSVPYSEEFDFEAMNEKFKKDEVWGALGKLDRNDVAETVDSTVYPSLQGTEGDSLTLNSNVTTAYKKDDFFDTISCNSLSHGARTSHPRFSERMTMDAQTFGNFRVRPPHQNYSAYGVDHGQNHRGRYNWGRGYGYGRSGRYMP